MSDDLKQKIVAVFESELPDTVRILNKGAVIPEAEPDLVLDEDEFPPQEVEDAYEAALLELVNEGILQTGEALGMTVYGFTRDHQEKLIAEGKIECKHDAETP